MPVYRWSQTPTANASADPGINYQEGQPPSSLNDSARGAMAAIAQWRDDISGATVTTGTSAAYALSTFSVFTSAALLANQVVAFTPHVTNATGPVTMTVDSVPNIPLRSAPNKELPAGVLVQGTPYVAVFNNTDGALYLQGLFGNPYNIPVGGFLDYGGATAPNSSFVLAYGQAISRTTYATLFGLFSTTYGAGDGTTTFNVPDLRGRVTAGKDDMGGSAASRLTSSYFGGTATNLGAVGGSESHTLTTAQLASHSHANSLTDPGHSHTDHMNVSFGASGSTFGLQGQVSSGTTSTNTTGITINNASAGSGNAHNNVQPTIVLSKILRII